jgi:hypothetical protein
VLATQLADQLSRLAYLRGIEAHGRLIKDQHRRAVEQRIGQAHALAEAFGQVGDCLSPHRAQPAPLDQRLILWLSLAQLITWGSVFYTFALLMEPIEHELGLTRAQSSVAFSLALLAEGLCAYPVGRLIDRGNERLVMGVGSLLVGLCLLLHSFVLGQPYRLRQFRRVIEHIVAQRDRIWLTRPGAICDYIETLPKGIVPGSQ